MEYSMIPEIGHFALILALGVSIIQGVLPLIGAQQGLSLIHISEPTRPY